MNLSRLTYVMNEMHEDIDKLVFLCSLRGTEYEKYIWELIPPNLNVHLSHYDELDCVNDILVMTYKKYLDSEFDEWMGYIELVDIVDTVNIDTLRYFIEIEELNVNCCGIMSAIEKKRQDIIKFLRESNYPVDMILFLDTACCM